MSDGVSPYRKNKQIIVEDVDEDSDEDYEDEEDEELFNEWAPGLL